MSQAKIRDLSYYFLADKIFNYKHSMASNDSDHSKVLKRLRPSLIRELPDPVVMLDSPELKGRLSGYEKSQISSPSVLCERAEMFINVIEFTSNDVFQLFLVVLKRLKPELGDRLERAWREVSRISANGSGESYLCVVSRAWRGGHVRLTYVLMSPLILST